MQKIYYYEVVGNDTFYINEIIAAGNIKQAL